MHISVTFVAVLLILFSLAILLLLVSALCMCSIDSESSVPRRDLSSRHIIIGSDASSQVHARGWFPDMHACMNFLPPSSSAYRIRAGGRGKKISGNSCSRKLVQKRVVSICMIALEILARILETVN